MNDLKHKIVWKILKPIRWKCTDLVRYVIPRRFTCESPNNCNTKFWVFDRQVVYPMCPSCGRHCFGFNGKNTKMEGKPHYQHN
jgi:hypothetical protein